MKQLLLLFAGLLSVVLLQAQTQPSASAEAALYYQNGEYEKALTLYEKLFQQNRSNYYDPYFNVLLKLKKYGEAERLVKKQLKTTENSPVYQVDYGRLLQEQGEEKKAKTWFAQLIEKLPENELLIRETAHAFYRAEAYDYAVKTFLRGRELLKDRYAFGFDLIMLYRYQKNKEMLIQEYLQVLSRSPQVLTQAQNIISSVLENAEDYTILKRIVLARLQKEPQNIVYAELLIWTHLQLKEFTPALKQSLALDKRLREDGGRIYELIPVFLSNRAYPQAVEGLSYLAAKGPGQIYYIPARVQLLNTKYRILLSENYTREELAALEKEYLALLDEFGRSKSTVFALRQLAELQAHYLDKLPQALTLLEQATQLSGLTDSELGQTKLELADLYVQSDETWEASLVYQQVEKQFPDQPMGHEAKFKNAKLSYYTGDFIWAKAQLDVLKNSTSQLIANDALNLSLMIAKNTTSAADSGALKLYAAADLLLFKNNPSKALTVLDSIAYAYPGNSLTDDILMAKARIYLKQKDFLQATVQLEQIVSAYGSDLWADDALFMLADLYEHQLHNPEKAKEYYQKLILTYPSSLHTGEARSRFRNLRGD